MIQVVCVLALYKNEFAIHGRTDPYVCSTFCKKARILNPVTKNSCEMLIKLSLSALPETGGHFRYLFSIIGVTHS